MNNEEQWYVGTKEEVIKKLDSDGNQGLSSNDVEERLKKYGRNELPKKKPDSFLKLLGKQLLDPIVGILIVTVIFSFLINEVIDAVAIIFIIVVDVFLGAFQEWKASKTTEQLQKLLADRVKVIRNGQEEEIDVKELVIGDLVLLESGELVGADLRLLTAHNLQVNESTLTGESVTVTKEDISLPANTALALRKNMIFAGTTITTGRATCMVVATAIHTEIGKIADKVTTTKEEKSPLTLRMEKFSKQISLLIVAVAVLIMLVLIAKQVPGKEIFLAVIALSVSAMPEGLPLALTMALTIASNRMAKKNVIVKKLNAVESLGSCTVIATDKTGTLTVNEQTAKKIVFPDQQAVNIPGSGLEVDELIDTKQDKYEEIKKIALLGTLNNEAGVHIDSEGIQNYYGDSIDLAFLILGKKAEVTTEEIEIIGRIPYESENKYSAVFYQKDGQVRCTVKGSIEKVLSFSDRMLLSGKESKLDSEILLEQNEQLAKEGYRVIAVADGEVAHFTKKEDYSGTDIPDLCFEGMTAFIDPIRDEVKESIEECKTAGIKVLMITGDHPYTAFTIAKELGIAKALKEVTTGEELNEYLNKGKDVFDAFIQTKRVFTRVTPLDKLEIVESLKRQDEFVAVTGDGVNDAPAIRSANIGIAMGSGTDVAKETASMIILDDNFKSIVEGVKEGRTAYSNIRKVCYMLLSCGLAEVLFFVLSIIGNLPMPLVAIQLLWLNIVTDGLQDIALSFEQAEDGIMKIPPRSTKETIFNKMLFSEVLLAGLTIGGIVFGVWSYLIYSGMDVVIARGYIMALMVFMQNVHVFNCRSEIVSTFKISIKENLFVPFAITAAILLQVIVMEVPVFSKFLQTTSVPILDLFKLLSLAFIILIVMETYKKIKYRKKIDA